MDQKLSSSSPEAADLFAQHALGHTELSTRGRRPGGSRRWISHASWGVALVVAGSIALLAARGAVSICAVDPDPPGMVRIPGTIFDMGSTLDEIKTTKAWCATFAPKYCAARAEAFDREQLAHTPVAGFTLDKYEVARSEFAAMLTKNPALAHDLVVGHLVATGPGTGITQDVDAKHFTVDGDGKLPAIGISWDGARRYCAALHKRLPTAAEWELAARGAARSRFPWGDPVPDCTYAVFGSISVERWVGCSANRAPHDVDETMRDVTPEGVVGLAGNVAEWVDGPPGASCTDGVERPLRGGSYRSLPDDLRGARQRMWCGTTLSPDVGIRCAQ